MKTKIVFILACLTAFAATMQAQEVDFEKMPQKQRDSTLIAIAKAAVMRHGPDWYRDYKIEINSHKQEVGPNIGKKDYTVTFYYDPKKEYMHNAYAVMVKIRFTGQPYSIWFGNDGFYQIDLPPMMLERYKNQLIMPFRPMQRPKPYQPGDSIVEE